nr:hypothetical protein HK105_003156 [Polyrhizophydium stewartii]
MKHGTRFWQKKLGRSPQHRKDLMRNLLTELVEHERITTTVAKAKFVQHEMELSQERTVPKLMHTLAERYQDRGGGYLRILRAGFNSPGSDRAPRAIVELVNNPKDLRYASAKVHGDQTLQALQALEAAKYRRETVTLQDPRTGASVEVVKLTERGELGGHERYRMTRREIAMHKQLLKMRQALRTYDAARDADGRQAHQIAATAAVELQKRLQGEVKWVLGKGRQPSAKFRDTIGKLGFEVNADNVVVAKDGAAAAAQEGLVRADAPVAAAEAGAAAPAAAAAEADVGPESAGSAASVSIAARLLSQLGLGRK